MLLSTKPPDSRVEPFGTYILLMFGVVFFVQVVTQQLFVRLLPYLFALSLPKSAIRAALATASVATGTSAVLGVFALFGLGLDNFKRRLNIALVFLMLAASVALMDGMRFGVPTAEFTRVYGSSAWLFLTILVELLGLSVSLYLVISSALGLASGSVWLRLGALLSSVAVSVMLLYYTANALLSRGVLPGGDVSGYLLGAVFNLAILSLGMSIMFMGVHKLLRLERNQKIFPVLLGIAFVLVLWYSLYGNFFSLKILELTWETSFGAPLPAGESLVFGFFAGLFAGASVTLAFAGRNVGDILGFFGFVALFSSLFLANTLTLYLEATVIGLVCYVIPDGGGSLGI